MPSPTRILQSAVVTAAAVSALLAGTSAATAAPPSTPSLSSAIVHPASGSGTVNDPWVPEKSATIVCQSATIFGNYTPGSGHSTPLGTLYAGYHVGVRYETSDHNSVMAYSADVGTWGYVLRSCVQFA